MSCLKCKHFNLIKWGTCTAYPKGIPFEIQNGSIQHIKQYKNDNGIIFEDIKLQTKELFELIYYKLTVGK